MNSIRLRLLLISGLVLFAFVLITGFALQKANESTALQAQQERMQGLVYALLGAIEIDGDAFLLNAGEVPEPRLSTPGSGLEARVIDADKTVAWQSGSTLDAGQAGIMLAPGQWSFETDENGGRFETAFGFRWLAESGSRQFTIRVSESMQDFQERESTFQRNLWLWLLIPAGLLLVIQLVVLAWVTRPLKALADEVRGIEQGRNGAAGHPADGFPGAGASAARGCPDAVFHLVGEVGMRGPGDEGHLPVILWPLIFVGDHHGDGGAQSQTVFHS